MKADLPKRVQIKHGAYYYVTAQGAKRIWTRLSAVRDGMPAMYMALAELNRKEILDDRMPALITDWLTDVATKHTPKTQENDAYQCRNISDAFVEFRASQIRPPDVVEFLQQYRDMPRTYNAHRAILRDLMRYAEQRGMREPGSNPVDSIKTIPMAKRNRYITDSELRRIKVAAVYGEDGKPTRSGLMICALIDLAYLTGQRIGDLITLKWSQVGRDGILFNPSKVSKSTGAKVFIEMTPHLAALVARLKVLKRADITANVITRQNGQPFKYTGAFTAWKRAVKRAGVAPCHFHDIRAKAITDVDAIRGIGEAQRMGGHSTQAQTKDYIHHKTALRTAATR